MEFFSFETNSFSNFYQIFPHKFISLLCSFNCWSFYLYCQYNKRLSFMIKLTIKKWDGYIDKIDFEIFKGL